MVDLDHLFDYVKDNGWNLDVKHFYQYINGGEYERLYLLFHAYEYLLPIVFIIIITDNNLMIIAAAIGFTQHLLFDQITNPMKPMTYFLIYRLKNRFSKKSLLKDKHISSSTTDQVK